MLRSRSHSDIATIKVKSAVGAARILQKSEFFESNVIYKSHILFHLSTEIILYTSFKFLFYAYNLSNLS